MIERHRDLHDRLGFPDALLSRTDLVALGLRRRGVDEVFRELPVLVLRATRGRSCVWATASRLRQCRRTPLADDGGASRSRGH